MRRCRAEPRIPSRFEDTKETSKVAIMAEGRGALCSHTRSCKEGLAIHYVLAGLKMNDTFLQRLRHRFDASYYLVLCMKELKTRLDLTDFDGLMCSLFLAP
jgi:hypothetical protein